MTGLRTNVDSREVGLGAAAPPVTIVIPTIPPRAQELARAVDSAVRQTMPCSIVVQPDVVGHGAAVSRNQALRSVQTEWVAFLDDDDELDSDHVELLYRRAVRTGADVVYPWFRGINEDALAIFDADGRSRTPRYENWGPDHERTLMGRGNFIPVTALVRTELARKVGGFPQPFSQEWPHADCEDWGFWQRLFRAGAVFEHLPCPTWTWHEPAAGHTSGRPWTELRHA